MKLLNFLAREAKDAPRGALLAMTTVSAVATSLMLALTNLGAEQVARHGAGNIELLIAYLIVFGVLLEARSFALTRSVTAVEQGVLRLRLRLIDKIRRQDLRFIEDQGGIGTFAPLNRDIGLISQAVVFVVPVAESLLILLFTCLYVAWLSPQSLLAVLAIYLVALPIYLARFLTTRDDLRQATVEDNEFFERFTGVLLGFKELKLDRRESDGVFERLRQTSETAYLLKLASSERQTNDVIFAGSIFYLALLAVVFAIPALTPETSATIHKVAAAVIFMIAPLAHLVNGAPTLVKADVAIRNLYALEERLDEARTESADAPPEEARQGFERIELKAATFRYPGLDGRTGFGIGPLDLTLNRGERVFVVGDNGSGKTTLIKLLTGLYRPDGGKILLDGSPVTNAERTRYSSLFASVFTDFHLFDRIYGIPHLDPAHVNRALADLGLVHKTHYTDQGYTSIDLSTGQRKRLAFLAAVLKNRAICVFDELAADQDPEFRRRLYEEILPKLSAEGRTLILISHDDRYFHTADRVLEMRDGQLLERTPEMSRGVAG
jgi:putative ATP-binding cassette transporter